MANQIDLTARQSGIMECKLFILRKLAENTAKKAKNNFISIVIAALSVRWYACYLKAKPESGYFWKPYKQKLCVTLWQDRSD